jgi:dTDP-4-dehydrorhamnose 3,5-epimerase
MSRFEVRETPLSGLKVVRRIPMADKRGHLTRVFCAEDLAMAGWRSPVAQINHTLTFARGVVRGLHFQRPPHSEIKLVTCLRGAVWDVAVDVRANSPTFLRWHAEELSADNSRALLVPEGFAHGFQTLSDDVEMLYVHSVPHVPESEAGLNPQDAMLGIEWPLPISDQSTGDETRPMLTEGFQGVVL